MNKKTFSALTLFLAFYLGTYPHHIWAAEYVVTRTDDPVPQTCTASSCSLREAVIAANSNPGDDIIWLLSETYELTQTGTDDTAQAGDLDVLGGLIIQHVDGDPNHDPFHIEANMNDRVLDVHPGASLSLIYGVISGGTVLGSGGGILANEAELIITDSTIKSNHASNGGAFFLHKSSAEITSSEISSNVSTDKGGGGFLGTNSQLLMDGVSIGSNTAQNGGGLYFAYLDSVSSEPDVQIKNSDFWLNDADYGGALNAQGSFGETTGRIVIEETVFKFNYAEKWGGAVFHLETDLTIKDSLFRKNKAASDDTAIIGEGGAIYSGMPFYAGDVADLIIENSLFEENQADGNGGAIHLADNNVSITNSTFSKNSANNHVAISAVEGDLSLQHVTIFSADVKNLIEIFVGSAASGKIQNSIIRGRCQMISSVGFQSLGGNVESPGDSCGLGSGVNDLVEVAPRFLKLEDELQYNGGSTHTHAIRYQDSFAVGNAIPISGINHDQRQMSRDAMPDSGAFEVHESDLVLIFKDGFE